MYDLQEAFRSVLSNNLVIQGTTEQLQRLRVLSIKNLAITVSKQQGRNKDALVLFQQAIAGNSRDISLIDKFGTLAAREGEWNASKDAFLSGLAIDASHFGLQSKLSQVLDHLNDYNSRLSTFGSLKDGEVAVMRTLGTLPSSIECGSQATVKDGPAVAQVIINVKDWTELLIEVGRLTKEHGSQCLVTVQEVNNEVQDHNNMKQLPICADTNSSLDENSSMVSEGTMGMEAHILGRGLLFDSWKSFIPPVSAMDLVPVEHEDNTTLYSVPTINKVTLNLCSIQEWPIKELSEVIMMYFLGSEELQSLNKDCATCLMNILEQYERPLPLDYTLTMSEWLIEQMFTVKEDCMRDVAQSKILEEEMKKFKTVSDKLLLRLAIQADSFQWKSKEDEARFLVRLYFAQGKKMQLLDKPVEAKEYLAACLDVLQDAKSGIRLLHLNSENIITPQRVRFNLESVDIHSEIQKIRLHPLDESGGHGKLEAFTQKILSDQNAESFMMSVDPLGWSSIMRELIDAAIKCKDYQTCIRCQIRLLFVNLPDVPDLHSGLQGSLEFLEPLFTTTFMNFIMNSVQLDKILYKNVEKNVLNEYEKNMLRLVLERLLVIMDACHQLLVGNEVHVKSKHFKVLLCHATSFFLGLLSLECCKDKDAMLVEQSEVLFGELGRLGVLLDQRSLVPYFALPLLRQVYSKISSTNSTSLDILSTQMEHMITFGFGVCLTAQADAGKFQYVDSINSCSPRGITSLEEILFLWPLLFDSYLCTLSNQMLKRRASEFILKCYDVVLPFLPRHVQTSMLASLEKCALFSPGKVCSGDVTSPFTSFQSLGLLDPHKTMDAQAREGILKVFTDIFDLKIKLEPLDLQYMQKQKNIAFFQGPDFLSLEQKTYPYIWNLAFNPDSIEHWQALAEFHLSIYEQILHICLSDGRHPSLTESERLVRHRNISYWCSYIACDCADKQWKGELVQSVSDLEPLSKVFEFHGQALLNHVTRLESNNVEEEVGKGRQNANIRENLEKICAAYIGATRFAPNKYSNHMLLGVCMKRLEYPPKVYMQRFVDACKLARQEHGALMDPLYELHAARMDLLESVWDPRTTEFSASPDIYREILEICSQTRFSEVSSSETFSDEAKLAQSLHADTEEAMLWCLEVDRYFHKAIMQLAVSKASDPETRYKYLNTLFTKGNQLFIVNVWTIREKGPHMSRSKGRKRKTNDTKVPFLTQEQAAHGMTEGSINLDDPNIRKPAVKSVGIGMNQVDTRDNHNLCIIRNALLEYIAVLRDTQRVGTLQEIIDFLQLVEDGIFRIREYQEIIALCKTSAMFISFSQLDRMIPSNRESLVEICTSPRHPNNMSEILFQCNDTLIKNLEFALELHLMYVSSSKRSWIESIVHPVAKYLLWRQSRHEASDEGYAKILITKQGAEILALYSCVYVKLLESHARYIDLIALYVKFLSSWETPEEGVSSLGMTLCISSLNAVQFLTKEYLKIQPSSVVEKSTDDGESIENTLYTRILEVAVPALAHADAITKATDLEDHHLNALQRRIKEVAVSKLESTIQQIVQKKMRLETGNISLIVSRAQALASIGLQDEQPPPGLHDESPQESKQQHKVQERVKQVERTQSGDDQGAHDQAPPGNDPEQTRPSTGIAAMAIQALFSQPTGQ